MNENWKRLLAVLVLLVAGAWIVPAEAGAAEPIYSTQPVSQVLSVGQTLHLEALMTGTDSLNVQWTRNGQALSGQTNVTLRIPVVSRSHSGGYRLQSSSLFGTVLTDVAWVEVLAAQNILSSIQPASGRFNLRFRDADGLAPNSTSSNAIVEYSSDLATWSTLQNSLRSEDGYFVIDDDFDDEISHRFYRVRISPRKSETNIGDGISSIWRQRYFGAGYAANPLALATADPDDDGSSNFMENLFASDPMDPLSVPLLPGTISTLAGGLAKGDADGPLLEAMFHAAGRMTFDKQGNLLVTETVLASFTTTGVGGHRIRRIGANGRVETIAGSALAGYVDSLGPSARFRGPQGIVVDSNGMIFVADRLNHRIRQIDNLGKVSTYLPKEQPFQTPIGMIIDGADNIYVGEFDGFRISQVSSEGVISTFAGTGVRGHRNGYRMGAQFNGVHDVALAHDGTMYVADWGNHALRRIDANGQVSTLVRDLPRIESVTVDRTGNLYVSLPTATGSLRKYDQDGNLIWHLSVQAEVDYASKALVLENGNIVMADSGSRVREIHMITPEPLTVSSVYSQSDESSTVTATAITPNLTIRYTTGSTTPTTDSALYAEPLHITSLSTLKFALFQNNIRVSDPVTHVHAMTD